MELKQSLFLGENVVVGTILKKEASYRKKWEEMGEHELRKEGRNNWLFKKLKSQPTADTADG